MLTLWKAPMTLRSKRVWIPTVVIVLVLGIVVVGDQLVRSSAETRIAKTVACVLRSSGPTTAHLADPLASLGVLDGDLGTVNVSVRRVGLGAASVDVKATLDHVTTAGKASGGKASATVGYDQVQKQLSAALGTDLQVAGDGRELVISTTFGVPVTVHATVAAQPQALTVTPTEIIALGQKYSIPTLLSSSLGKALPKDQLQPHTIQLPGLPAGINLSAATPAADGLHLSFGLTSSIVTPACTR